MKEWSSDGHTVTIGAPGADDLSSGLVRVCNFPTNATVISDKKLEVINVFPNPTKGEITIQFLEPLASEISVVNINGRLDYSNRINEPLTKINLSELINGVYFLYVRNDADTRFEKIILNK